MEMAKTVPPPWKIGLTIFLAGCAVFALFTASVIGQGHLAHLDQDLAQSMQNYAENHRLVSNMLGRMTLLGSMVGLTCLALAGAAWQWLRGRRWLAIGWLVAALLGSLINYTIKEVIDRDRPPRAWRDQAVFEDNESFPSGHSMGGTIGLGLVAYALCLENLRRCSKVTLVAALVLLELTIAFSRVYLRAHWCTDVIAGLTLGAA